jgi:hypothetical protein
MDEQPRVLSQGSTLSGASRQPHDFHGRWLANPSHEVLRDFMEGSHPWHRERVPFPRRLRTKLWPSIPLRLMWAICLVTVLTGTRPCGGPFCNRPHAQPSSPGASGVHSHLPHRSRCVGSADTGSSSVERQRGNRSGVVASGAALHGITAPIISGVISPIRIASFALGFAATS